MAVGSILGLCANTAAAAQWVRLSSLRSNELNALTANNTALAQNYFDQNDSIFQSANTAESIQQFSEVVVLLIIVAAFISAGVLGGRRINSAMPLVRAHASDAAVTLRQIQRQLFITVFAVFLTFLLRAVFSVMYAVANTSSDNQPNCTGLCSSCNSVNSLMRIWITLTPEFQLVVELLSSPLAMLVALWGMTSHRTLQIMKAHRQNLQLQEPTHRQKQHLQALIAT